MLRQTIAPSPKWLYDYMTHLAMTQSGRWLEQKHTTSGRRSWDSSLWFCDFNEGTPCAMNPILLNPIHVLSYHIMQTEIHFSVPRLREKSQSAQKSIQQQVCHWSSLLVVIFCVCAWLLSVNSENPRVRWQSPFHTSHSARRGSIYFESFVSLLQFKGKKNKIVNTYQHNHLHVSFFFNT